MNTMIDPTTVAKMAVEGLEILREYHGYAQESADRKREVALVVAKAGDPFRRLKGDLDYARDFLDNRAAGRDKDKRLRVSIAHEVLSAVVTSYYPET